MRFWLVPCRSRCASHKLVCAYTYALRVGRLGHRLSLVLSSVQLGAQHTRAAFLVGRRVAATATTFPVPARSTLLLSHEHTRTHMMNSLLVVVVGAAAAAAVARECGHTRART